MDDLLERYERGTQVGDIQVLFFITVRLGSLAAVYGSIAYALALKEVGVLMQSMYLVATAMGLAPCAVGGGESDVIARALGVDALVEPAVGEFLLGGAPA